MISTPKSTTVPPNIGTYVAVESCNSIDTESFMFMLTIAELGLAALNYNNPPELVDRCYFDRL